MCSYRSDIFKMCSIKLFLFPVILYIAVAKDMPSITSTESNATVVVGRDISLTCNVENLQNYMVAWLRVDTQTILTVGQLVVTKNPRVGVLSGPHSCTLTLRDVRQSDVGQYMCQLNTDPMIVQIHHLQVYVPPEIVDSNSTGEVNVAEGVSVSLHCEASGNPRPNITWRREDSKPLVVAGENVLKWEGIWLNISVTHRNMNCVLLCIASNGVPPSVSKRILLNVLSRPRVKAFQQEVRAYIYSVATLRCHIEGYPPPTIYWSDMRGNRLTNGFKYETKTNSRGDVHVSSVTINNVSGDDAGNYECHAENSLGAESCTVTLYTLATSTESSTSTVRTVTSSIPVTTATNFTTSDLTASTASIVDKGSSTSSLPVILSRHQMQYPDVTSVS